MRNLTHDDDRLGALVHKRGYWRGTLELPAHGQVRLAVAGDSSLPDSAALLLARELAAHYESLLPEIEESLYRHFLPYREAFEAGESSCSVTPFPAVSTAAAVWLHAHPNHVLVAPLQGIQTVEIGYLVEWDQEHTVGALLQQWRLIELCGSVRSI